MDHILLVPIWWSLYTSFTVTTRLTSQSFLVPEYFFRHSSGFAILFVEVRGRHVVVIFFGKTIGKSRIRHTQRFKKSSLQSVLPRLAAQNLDHMTSRGYHAIIVVVTATEAPGSRKETHPT